MRLVTYPAMILFARRSVRDAPVHRRFTVPFSSYKTALVAEPVHISAPLTIPAMEAGRKSPSGVWASHTRKFRGGEVWYATTVNSGFYLARRRSAHQQTEREIPASFGTQIIEKHMGRQKIGVLRHKRSHRILGRSIADCVLTKLNNVSEVWYATTVNSGFYLARRRSAHQQTEREIPASFGTQIIEKHMGRQKIGVLRHNLAGDRLCKPSIGVEEGACQAEPSNDVADVPLHGRIPKLHKRSTPRDAGEAVEATVSKDLGQRYFESRRRARRKGGVGHLVHRKFKDGSDDETEARSLRPTTSMHCRTPQRIEGIDARRRGGVPSRTLQRRCGRPFARVNQSAEWVGGLTLDDHCKVTALEARIIDWIVIRIKESGGFEGCSSI
nr:hypothetical protein CFP56_11914 [Quercus suber]